MKTKQLEEYEQEREAIERKYLKKGKKFFKKFLIGFASLYVLGSSFFIVNSIKSDKLEKNYPIYQQYIGNQSSLRYLRNKLKQYKPERFPEFLSQDIKNELENISIQEDFAKISSLEKLVKITKQEEDKIINTPAYKEYSEKSKRNERIKDFSLLGVMGIALASMPGYFFIMRFNSKRKNEELGAPDKKYNVTKSLQ